MLVVFISIFCISVFIFFLTKVLSHNEGVGTLLNTKEHQETRKKSLLQNLLGLPSPDDSAHTISKNPTQEIEKCQKLMKKFPRASKYPLRLAALYTQIDSLDNAYSIYTKLEKDKVIDKVDRSQENSLHLLNFTTALIEKGNISKAKHMVEACHDAIPQNPKVTFLQGKIAFLEERYAESMQYFATLERLPEYTDKVRSYWGLSLYHLGEYARAIPPLEKELLLSVTPELNFAIADSIHHESGLDRDLSQYLDPLLKDPQWTIQAALLEGENFMKKGEEEKAVALYQKSIKLQPLIDVEKESTLEIRYRLALCFLDARKLKEANKLLHEIYTNEPDYEDVEVLIDQFRDMVDSPAMYDFISGPPEKLKIVCEKIIQVLHKDAVVQTETFDLETHLQEVKMIVRLESRQFTETIEFFFMRKAASILEISQAMKLLAASNQDRLVLITYGEVEGGLRKSLEGRPMDLVDRATLAGILNSLK